MDTSLEDRIRTRAYELWEIEGRPSGRDQEHWDRAQREIQSGERADSADIAPPEDTADGVVVSGLKSGGTTPGDGLGAGLGSIGTSGASTAGTASESVRNRSPS